jgi:hypothetical protein
MLLVRTNEIVSNNKSRAGAVDSLMVLVEMTTDGEGMNFTKSKNERKSEE